jgi:GWxTD domain-containing protein
MTPNLRSGPNRRQMLRAFLPLLLVLLAFIARPGEAPAADSDLDARIKTLSRQVKRPGTPDSVRYELAMRLAERGTIEDRYQALRTFRGIRPTYDRDPDYHRDIARIFIGAKQPSRAVASLEEVVARRTGDVEAMVLIARLLLDDLLYHYDLRNTDRMVSWLDRALAINPNHREALFLSSLTMQLAASRPEAPAEMSERGKELAARLLDAHPDDVAARMLLGVHELDLGRPEAARAAFLSAFDSATPEVRNAFLSLDQTANPRALESAGRMDEATKAEYSALYWITQDPTPVTLLNENQLEVWKRMALAEFLFGQPDRRLRGWDVPAGEAFVRFGPPSAHGFDPGDIRGQGGKKDVSSIEFVPPSWNWVYVFRDMTFALKFEDTSLNGNFYMDPATKWNMEQLRKRAPVIYDDATPGRIRYLYMSSDGVAGPTRLAKQRVHLAVPLWRQRTELEGMERVTVDIRVENRNRSVVRHSRRIVTGEDLASPASGLDMLLITSEFTLGPGRYRATAFVSDPERKVHGVHSIPFEVRDYHGEPEPVLSDLALSFRLSRGTTRAFRRTLGEAHLPNPMGMVGDERNLNIFYEMYGMKTSDGAAVQEARYTIVPTQVVRDYEARVERKELAIDFPTFVDAAVDAGIFDLGPDNYLDTRFPEAPVEVKGGTAAKATRLSLGRLVPGEYALIVTVRDAGSDRTASARTHFRILADEVFRGLFGK